LGTRSVRTHLDCGNVVDDFGVKYVSKHDVNHLIDSIKATYMLTMDWMGKLYCGITLEWDYVHQQVDTYMLNYLKKNLQEYRHIARSGLA
jgi:hypothetical protein